MSEYPAQTQDDILKRLVAIGPIFDGPAARGKQLRFIERELINFYMAQDDRSNIGLTCMRSAARSISA